MKKIFITGGTGYMGKRLIPILLSRGHPVKALVRNGSENKLPKGCDYIIADAFDAAGFANAIPAGAIFIQLLGVPHPGPSKKELFKSVDLMSVKASAAAAKKAGVLHFVYISVSQTPVTIMQAYQQCRAEGEKIITATNIPATFIRPWYVIGPGHYWPLFFLPFFKILEWIPFTSQKAKAIRFVYLKQIVNTLVYAVNHPPENGIKIIEIAEIRKF